MKELFRSTDAWKRIARDREDLAHTVLLLDPDEGRLRDFLIECAKGFFGDEPRASRLIGEESFSDCRVYPPAGGKYSTDLAAEIVEESALRPVEGRVKLFLLDRFHTALPVVQNKLLKLLEEPPSGVYFFLGTTSEHAVLPTVLSRAVKFSVPPFSEREIGRALARMYGEREGIRGAAAASGGILSVAETLLKDGGEEFALAEQFLLSENAERLARTLGDRKEKLPLLSALRSVLRDALFWSMGREKDCARVNQNIKRIAAEYPAGVLISAIGWTSDGERDLKFNANFGQTLTGLAFRIRKEKIKWRKLS